MNKKLIILAVVALVVVSWLAWSWWDYQAYIKDFEARMEEFNKNMPEGLKYEKDADGVYRIVSDVEIGEPVGDFSIQDTLEGKIIENEEEGLKARVPEGWSVEKMEIDPVDTDRGVELSSPDVKLTSDNMFLERGCVIGFMVEKSPLQFEVINDSIETIRKSVEKNKTNLPTLEENGYEIIEIDNKPGLKELLFKKEVGMGIEVRIPTENDKNIYFGLQSSPESEKMCMYEFDKFLDTVSID